MGKILKLIFQQGVDLLFLAVMIGMLIAWIINPTNNFTGALILVVGYVIFNIYNKVRLIIKLEKQWTKLVDSNYSKK
jgi:uncharacterized membrane protein YqjE